jgi:hypothetical protein
MKATFLWTGTLLLAGVVASLAQAQPCSPALHTPYPQAPDACGPGFYWACPNGTVYGPNYWLQPPTMPFTPLIQPGSPSGYPGQPGLGQGPFNGMGMGPRPTAVFPTHPFARSPRDFFMVYDRDR